MQDLIGLIAGKIWKYLSENGKTEVTKIRFDLKLTNALLFLAIGWLSREDKINITKEENKYFIELKSK